MYAQIRRHSLIVIDGNNLYGATAISHLILSIRQYGAKTNSSFKYLKTYVLVA